MHFIRLETEPPEQDKVLPQSPLSDLQAVVRAQGGVPPKAPARPSQQSPEEGEYMEPVPVRAPVADHEYEYQDAVDTAFGPGQPQSGGQQNEDEGIYDEVRMVARATSEEVAAAARGRGTYRGEAGTQQSTTADNADNFYAQPDDAISREEAMSRSCGPDSVSSGYGSVSSAGSSRAGTPPAQGKPPSDVATSSSKTTNLATGLSANVSANQGRT